MALQQYVFAAAGIVFLLIALFTIRRGMAKGERFDFKIKFHSEAHPIGCHGMLYVDCPAKNMKGQPIAFVLIGVPATPNLSMGFMKKLWTEAELAGYAPLAVKSYVGVAPITGPNRPVGVPVKPTAHVPVQNPEVA
jgi:hypothetical protein